MQERASEMLKLVSRATTLSWASRGFGAATIVAAAACWLPISQPRALAADFPDDRMEIPVTFAPGGTPDIPARALSEGLAADLKQPVVVVTKLGAGGAV